MGIIQSVICSLTFCCERVLTWTCCAFLLMLLMFSIIFLMIYGITVGYHYAQRELASFAMSSRPNSSTDAAFRVRYERPDTRVLNISQFDHIPESFLELLDTRSPLGRIYMNPTVPTDVVALSQRATAVQLSPTLSPKLSEQLSQQLSPRERELALKLIGRFRRSQNSTSTDTPFLRPLKKSTEVRYLLSS